MEKSVLSELNGIVGHGIDIVRAKAAREILLRADERLRVMQSEMYAKSPEFHELLSIINLLTG